MVRRKAINHRRATKTTRMNQIKSMMILCRSALFYVHEAEGDGECIGDSDRIAQLVGNLAANALAYGSTDHPVTVRSMVRPWQFAVSVHNHGAPIPLEAHSRLFEPLARGTTQGSSVRSVGLGLYIVSEIAKAHGGQVAVSSGEAEGTTFTATFPRGVDATSPRA